MPRKKGTSTRPSKKNPTLVHGTLVNLGDLGHALQIVTPTAENKRAYPIVVLDISSSMGDAAGEIANSALPKALLELGYAPEDTVTVIVFHAFAEELVINGRAPKISEMHGLNAECRGCTYMAGVFSLIVQTVKRLPTDSAVTIVCLSDGAVGDTTETLAASQKAATALSERSGTTSVQIIRYGNGADTKALASVAMLAKSGVKTDLQTVTDVPGVQGCIESTMRVDGTVSLRARGNVLRLSPSNPGSSELQLPAGRFATVLVAPGADLSGLTLDGAPVEIEREALTGEGQLRAWLGYISDQVKMMIVLGRRSQMTPVLMFLRKLSRVLAEVPTESEAAPGEGAETSKDRVHALRHKLLKQSKGVLHMILELQNQDGVERLNSAQQADFLTGQLDPSSAAAKRLAKRAGDLDFDEMARKAIASGANLPTMEAVGEASYISMETSSGIMQNLKELQGVDGVTIADLLTVLGLVGVAYAADRAPLPDPWSMDTRSIRVYLGVMLSECDLRDLETKGGGDFPGVAKPAPITGVIPLRSNDKESYDIYDQQFASVADLHASVNMRGVMATVPGDRAAQSAAVVYALCQQAGDKPSECEQRTITSLFENLEFLLRTYKCADLIDGLKSSDPRGSLTGENGVSGPLKPLALLIVSPELSGVRAGDFAPALRAIFLQDVVVSARAALREVDPNTELRRVLGVSTTVALTPLFEQDPPFDEGMVPVIDWTATLARVSELEWIPDPARLARAVRHTFAPDSTLSDVYGLPAGQLRALAALEVLIAPKEAQRINPETKTSTAPDYTDWDAWAAYLQEQAVEACRVAYDTAVARKAIAETEETMRGVIEQLVQTDKQSVFVETLQQIPSRSAPGFSTLEKQILDQGVTVPRRAFKLAVLLLGRDPRDPATPIWCDGNVLNGTPDRFHQYNLACVAAGGRWGELLEVHKMYSVYTYKHNGPNRHGHSNEFPSYYAFGCQTLEGYKDKVGEAQFALYKKAHKDCCGFARKLRKCDQ